MKFHLVITMVVSTCIASVVSRSVSRFDDYEAAFLESYSGNHDYDSDASNIESYNGYPVDDLSLQFLNGYERDLSPFVTFAPLYANDNVSDDKETHPGDNDDSDEANDNDNEPDDDSDNYSNEEADIEGDKYISPDGLRAVRNFDKFTKSLTAIYKYDSDASKIESYNEYPVADLSLFVTFVPLYASDNVFDHKETHPGDNDDSDEANDNDNGPDDDSDNNSNEEAHNEDDKDLSDDITTAVSENNENRHPTTHVIDDRDIFLQKLSSSSLNSELLTNAYADNIIDLKAAFEDTDTGLWSLLGQNLNIYENFYTTANEDSDYDGEKHRKLMSVITEMLTKVDEVRLQILKMQSIGQRQNYHQLLKALLKEIYGENKVLL